MHLLFVHDGEEHVKHAVRMVDFIVDLNVGDAGWREDDREDDGYENKHGVGWDDETEHSPRYLKKCIINLEARVHAKRNIPYLSHLPGEQLYTLTVRDQRGRRQ